MTDHVPSNSSCSSGSRGSNSSAELGQPLTRLSSPLTELSGHVSIAVIGSGYGGAITASRLARAGRQVWVLERGRELHPGEFPDTLPEALTNGQVHIGSTVLGSRTGLFDMRAGDDMNVLVGCGLGGTSLINANVSLAADPDVFKRDCWPKELQETGALDAGYERATAMLRPQQLPAQFVGLPKLRALRSSAEALPSGRFSLPPLNVTFDDGPNAAGIQQKTCNMCGDCMSGCNTGAKNTVLMNYLPDAVANGAKVFTKVGVHHLSHSPDGRWTVHYELLDTGGQLFDARMSTITADIVVLAAGTLGSTEILLRSRAEIELSEMLGKKFSGNGDVLAFSYNGDQVINGMGWGSHQHEDLPPVGPCITGLIDLRNGQLDQGMVIEEGSIPGGLAPYLSVVFSAADQLVGEDTDSGLLDELGEAWRQLHSAIGGARAGAMNNTLTYLVMAHDGADGTLELTDDHVKVVWNNVGDKPIFEAINRNLQAAASRQQGQYIIDPVWSKALGRKLITVHPLGGCPMGDNAESGVVNHLGQVFRGEFGDGIHEGLYVADGSIIPTSLGVNPLLTICALAERNAELLAQNRDWEIDYLKPTPKLPPRPTMTGILFTERMAGRVATGGRIPNDYRAARAAANSDMSFVFTIIVDDLEAFLDNPYREAALIGTVSIPALCDEPIQVSQGTFNLLVPNPDVVGTVDMRYRAKLTCLDGRTYLLKGRKDIRDDRGLDMWDDTTTLYTDILEGDKADNGDNGDKGEGRLVARGVLTIGVEDFTRQLRSIRVTGTHDIDEIVKTKARFATFFASELAHVYGGVASPSRLIATGRPPRKKRALLAPLPRLYPFTTDDGIDLLLTRFQGGGKGPVLVSHGLGVSSQIFTIDTIETNLVEYLCGNGFDVWLLDYRSSVNLKASQTQHTADEVAKYDYPAAVHMIRQQTNARNVQVVAHCFGSTTFMCAMLAGLQDVRAAVCSQIATHVVAPTITQLKSRLRVPEVLERLGLYTMTTRANDRQPWQDTLFDRALDFWPMGDQGCESAVCHRITFLYSLLYKHQQLNTSTHDDGLAEMFGVVNTSALAHLATIVRRGQLVGASGADCYMPNLQRLALPLTIVHGEQNACFLPESTQRTMDVLTAANGPSYYRRHVVPSYGHIDCIFGKNAVRDVYPLILQGLEPTATP